ncbi:transglycosylase SLT domain-containing protein, partial [bacterium]|nr:transglycosylase SLT domain-containing protein [bacterium]
MNQSRGIVKIFGLVRKCKVFIWTLGFGLWAGITGRKSNSAPQALFSGTVCAVLIFVALTAVLSQTPHLAEAVGLTPVSDLVAVDPDLVLGPGPGSLGDGPLVKRALAMADDPRVRVQLEHLLTDKRDDILDSLALSTRYLSYIIPILEKYDLPPELAYLCIIESGYRQSARSHAGAVGMWQMIRSTSSR